MAPGGERPARRRPPQGRPSPPERWSRTLFVSGEVKGRGKKRAQVIAEADHFGDDEFGRRRKETPVVFGSGQCCRPGRGVAGQAEQADRPGRDQAPTHWPSGPRRRDGLDPQRRVEGSRPSGRPRRRRPSPGRGRGRRPRASGRAFWRSAVWVVAARQHQSSGRSAKAVPGDGGRSSPEAGS